MALQPRNFGPNLELLRRPLLSWPPCIARHLADWDADAASPDPRILIVLEDYVYDVLDLKDFLGPNKLYSKYAGKDLSCALAKYSYDDEHIDKIGYLSLSDKERNTLKDWSSIFM
ncbi:hypothetical protein B0H13DRAFT_1855952 [Mycena leptocephala]|nr:hypothetical protein B0H13DRAFT_1855952 [Mycena leptocephala]